MRPTENLLEPGLRTYRRIASRWKLDLGDEASLLGLPPPEYRALLDGGDIAPEDLLERLSLILGIYKDLQILLPNATQADRWIKMPNEHPLFGGKSALQYLKGGSLANLWDLRKYLYLACH